MKTAAFRTPVSHDRKRPRCVSVIDEGGKLIGLVTDGDVRRGLETGSNFLQWPVDAMMTKNPRVIVNHKLATEALHIMEKNQPRPITVLPVVDEIRKSSAWFTLRIYCGREWSDGLFLTHVKMLALDVDGVLTDGIIYYSPSGDA